MTERTARRWREAGEGETWTYHLTYICDGDDLHLPPNAVIDETKHDTGMLAVWWREPAPGSDPGFGGGEDDG